jgi:hypothetical protein
MRRGASGRIGIGGLLFLLIVAGGVYVAATVIPPYWAYYSFKEDVASLAKMTDVTLSEDKIQKDLAIRARELGVPLREGDFYVQRHGFGKVEIAANWEVQLEFIGGYKRTLQFEVHALP